MGLHYKRSELLEQVQKLDWRLRLLVLPCIVRWAEDRGWLVFVTSAIRDDGVHGERRAVDLDIIPQGYSGNSPESDMAGRAIERLLNQHFAGRKWSGGRLLIGYFHPNRGSPGYHLHVQVPGRAMRALALA